ncbi:MAG: Rrf2 family transcriptional regulator, partial [Sedimentisphaerales bacterium]|nr:Rrf2 family transcriptional regulator [Sedimentisphaerales bacterium]
SDIFNALEGPIVTVECLESDEYCARAADCVARELWSKVQQAVIGVLESVTLEDLADRAKSNKTSYYQI